MPSSLEPLVGLAPEDAGLRDRRRSSSPAGAFSRGARGAAPARPGGRRPAVGRRRSPDFVDGLVDLVGGCAVARRLCARPELLERRPDWGGGKRNALTVSLGPLVARRDGAARRVAARARPGRRRAPPGVVDTRPEIRCTRRSSSACTARAGTWKGSPTGCSESSPRGSTCCRRKRSCCGTRQ